jgi:hypothetical protein
MDRTGCVNCESRNRNGSEFFGFALLFESRLNELEIIYPRLEEERGRIRSCESTFCCDRLV